MHTPKNLNKIITTAQKVKWTISHHQVSLLHAVGLYFSRIIVRYKST